MADKPLLSIVLTSYNEYENLQRGVLEQMYDYLKSAKFSWEMIINDDGSKDEGPKILQKFAKTHPCVKFIQSNHAGKAKGIWNGIQQAEGEIILFTDIDQSTPLKEVDKLLPWYDKGYDVVFGSRGKMRQNFAWHRQLTSWGFRAFRQSLLLRHITDTQCGFKSFRTPVAKQIFPMLEVISRPNNSTGWSVSAFDVELLFLAEKLGYKLKEVTVEWQDEDTSTGKSRNFMKESTDMLKQILRVKMNDLSGKYSLKRTMAPEVK